MDTIQPVDTLFLAQSYQDCWDEFEFVRHNRKAVRWDWFVITASNETQAEAYRRQIEERRLRGFLPEGTRFAVVSDTDGKRIGSGGATLNALRFIKQETGDAPFDGSRILLLHSGGDSKRIPQYSAVGKLFSRVPRQLPDGRPSTLFDEFLILMSSVPSRMTDGLFILSGDALLLFNPLQLDLQRSGIACISVKAPVETGKNHGVFLSSTGGRVKSFLHKKSEAQLRAAGAVNAQNCVDIDTGAFWLGSAMAERLYSLVTENGAFSRKAFDRFVNDTVRLNFYGDIVYTMTEESSLDAYLTEQAETAISEQLLECRTDIWNMFSGTVIQLIRTAPARFIHFGTTDELRSLMCSAADTYGFLGWKPHIMNTADSSAPYAAVNALIDADACIGAQSYIEDSAVRAGAYVGECCVLSHVRFSGRLEDGTVLHVLPVTDNGNEKYVCRIYGIHDNPKKGLDDGGTLIGTELRTFAGRAGISEAEIWDGDDRSLWTAALYPVCDTEEEAVKAALAVQSIVRGTASETEKKLWAASHRSSLSACFSCARVCCFIDEAKKTENEVRSAAIVKAVGHKETVDSILPLFDTSHPEAQFASILTRTEKYGYMTCARIYAALARSAQILFPHGTPGNAPFGYEQLSDRSFSCINEAIAGSLPENTVRGIRAVTAEKVTTAFPVRVNFGGGWTDTPPVCIEKGGTVLNAAVSLAGRLPVQVTVCAIPGDVIELSSRDLGYRERFDSVEKLANHGDPLDPFALHKAALYVTGIVPSGTRASLRDITAKLGSGLFIETDVNVPKGSGLGTSSILAAAVVTALECILGSADDVQRTITQVLLLEQMMSTGGGWQDQVGGLVPGIKMCT